MPNYQGVWSLSEQFQNASGWPIPPLTGDIALFGVASNSVPLDAIQISTTGNSTTWGTLGVSHTYAGATGSSTRGIIFGGNSAGQTITYVTTSNQGSYGDFGDTVAAATYYNSNAHASDTRGLFFGPQSDPNSIEYVTIATTGNATNFGNMFANRNYGAGTGSSTRAVIAGGYLPDSGVYSNTMDYVTIASVGNSSDFGDLLNTSGGNSACSSSTRSLFAGGVISGGTRSNTIAYVTTASTGNATDFGDLTTDNEKPLFVVEPLLVRSPNEDVLPVLAIVTY